MRNIFFVISSGSIYRRVIPCIDQIEDKSSILVVVPTEGMYKFFTNYTPFNTIQLKVNPNLITKKSWYKALSNSIKSKYEYHKLFADITGANIHFFSTGNAIVIFSYLQKLAKKNKLFFYSSYHEINDEKKEQTKKSNVMRRLIKVLLGFDAEVLDECGIIHCSIGDKFFKKNNVTATYKEFDTSIYKKYIKKISKLEGKKVLVLWSDLVAEGRVDEIMFRQQGNKLIDILDEVYPGQYIIKSHPNMSNLYGRMVCSPSIDSAIPSQFLMGHPWEIVIGDCTAALVFPEEQNLQNVKLIEMLDILQFKDEKVKKDMKQFLISWNNKLLFPKTFEEFEEMIK